VEIFIVYENGEYANLNIEGLYENLVQRLIAESGGPTPKLNVVVFDLQGISMQKRVNSGDRFFDL